MSEDERGAVPDRRKPGRPREFLDPSEVSFMLEGDLHEKLAREAKRRGDASISSVLRDIVTHFFATSTT